MPDQPSSPTDSTEAPPSDASSRVGPTSRRSVLIALGAGTIGGLAGCMGGDGGSDSESDPAETDGGSSGGPSDDGGAGETDANPASDGRDQEGGIEPPSQPEDPLGAGDVLPFETGPRTVALPDFWYDPSEELTVLVRAEEPATPDSPAVFRAALTNRRPQPRTIQLDRSPPFQQTAFGSAEDGGSVYFVPTEETPIATTTPEYSRGPDGYWRLAEPVGNWLPPTVELGPEEAISGLFYLLGAPDQTGFPTGQYEFASWQEEHLSLSVWNTDAPGPTVDSRFAPDLFPDLTYRQAEDTVWYNDVGPGSPRWVEPDAEHDTFPAGISFELINNSDESLSGGGGAWDLHKFVNGEWHPLATRWRTLELRLVSPGGRRAWEFLGFNGPVPEEVDQPAHGHLGGGVYAFRPTHTLGERETYAAAVELDGPPVDVVPRPEVTVDREGSTVYLTDPRRTTETTLVVERTDAASQRIIPEQLMSGREPVLRSAMPQFESGVEAVRFLTNDWTGDLIDEAGTTRFSYRGQAYAAYWDSLSNDRPAARANRGGDPLTRHGSPLG